MNDDRPMTIAVVGGGVAGITAAHHLQQRHRVTLFEANDYLGGHTNTVTIESGPDAGLAVDTGFIVLNDATYPNFMALLAELGVSYQPTEMSLSYCCVRSGRHYASTGVSGLFARRRNLLSPGHWRLLLGVCRFRRMTRRWLHTGRLAGLTLADYIHDAGFGQRVIDEYLEPMASAIWSAPAGTIFEFPAEIFARFYDNHGLLYLRDVCQWHTIPGGSNTYVRAFQQRFNGNVRLSTPVRQIRRHADGVDVTSDDAGTERFDYVVIAAHADQAKAMLMDPSADESSALGSWQYSRNQTILHTDDSVMPTNRRAWASWNYRRELDRRQGAPISVTYYMNRLQKFRAQENYFVTLNPTRTIADSHQIKTITYTHPIYTSKSVASQALLPKLNGQRRTYFCGSYFRYGFHEDAVASAVEVARHFGISQ